MMWTQRFHDVSFHFIVVKCDDNSFCQMFFKISTSILYIERRHKNFKARVSNQINKYDNQSKVLPDLVKYLNETINCGT